MKRTTKVAASLSTVLVAAAMLATGVSAHDNGAAKTPPMGWSSWNAFWANIDEDLITDTADAMVTYGLKDVGYEYVNLDDNWQSSERDENGRLQFDPIRFPHDGNWLSNYIHERGLKIGVYTSNGLYTCQDLPASEFRELCDATSFAEWEIDFFKYDYCHNVQLPATAYGIYGLKVAKPYTPGTEIYSYSYRDAKLEGTAVIKSNYIDGLGEDAGSATFTVTVPEDGEYALNLDFYKKPSGEDVPMFFSLNGNDAHPYRMMLPSTGYNGGAPGSRAAAIVKLNAGENTLKFFQPIRSSRRDYDSARYQYGFMRDNLMKATEKYAEENGKENRPIALEICEWGGRQPWTWGNETGNIWRTTGDISASWDSMINIYETNVKLYQYAGKYDPADGDNYGFNHPDMLEVGNGSLTKDENIAHFSLWCEMASPLILGNDLRQLGNRPDILEIITNTEAIAVNQDELCIQGIRYQDDGDLEYLVKPLTGGKVSLVMLNRSGKPAVMTTEISEIGNKVKAMDEYYYENHYNLGESYVYHLKDVWEKDEEGNHVEFDSAIAAAVVPSHGVKMYIIEPATNVEKGAYVIGSLSKTSLKAGEQTILTAKFVNGGSTVVENVGLSLNLPEGFTARPLSTTVGNDLATGEGYTVQYVITAGDEAVENVPITINAFLLYEGDKEPTSLSFDTVVTVKGKVTGTPVEYGRLTTKNAASAVAAWGTIRDDRSINGNPLTINGTTYERGIGTHANSEIIYIMDGRGFNFTAKCGSDADSGASGDIRFLVYGDDELLYDSGELDWNDDAKSIDVNGIGYDTLRLVVDNCGNQNYDHADWIDPQIAPYEPSSIEDGVLTTKNAMSVASYWRTPADGKNQDAGPMILGGVNYDREDGGFQVNAPSVVTYYLGGAPGIFTAKIGLGDEVLDNASGKGDVTYQIYGDGELLLEQQMDINSGIMDISVPMIGYDVLKLVVNDNGDTQYDHACWVEPRFTKSTLPLASMIEEANALLNAAEAGDLNGQTPVAAIEAFEAAIAEAQAVADNADATSEEISAAAVALRAAMNDFEAAKVVVDKSGLCGAIILAKCLNENDYDAAKWAAFMEVYNASYDVYMSEAVTYEDVAVAEENLREAMKNLKMVGGDINGNGTLDTEDLQMMKDYIAGKIELTPEQIAIADYDGNGKVNVIDLLKWKKILEENA